MTERLYTRKEKLPERKHLRNNSTAAESTLWKALRCRQIDGLKFRRQHSIGAYIMDFYCPEIKLCIELDGNVHDDYLQHHSDIIRTKFINEQGITIFRFSNECVYHNPDQIIEAIRIFNQCPKLRKGIIKDNNVIQNPPLTPPFQGGEHAQKTSEALTQKTSEALPTQGGEHAQKTSEALTQKTSEALPTQGGEHAQKTSEALPTQRGEHAQRTPETGNNNKISTF